MKIVDFDKIKSLNLSAEEMYQWTSDVWRLQDTFILPAKSKMWQGESGRYITMPCVLPQYDIAGVKFICRNVDDVNGLPARNSNIMLQNCSKHGLLAVMDGTYITNMRTGANAAYNAITFSKTNPKTLAVYGLGLTARAFMFFYTAMHKQPLTVKVLRYKNQAELFIEEFQSNPALNFQICDNLEDLFDADVIVSCVSFARKELCDISVYKEGCTVVPVHTSGFQNCDLAFDKVVVDDVEHVKGYRYFNEFQSKMLRITDVANQRVIGRDNDEQRIVIYDGGIAVHDLYFAMKILEKIGDDCVQIPMSYPQERFWI